MADFLFFDIETEMHPNAGEWVDPKPAPKNYKDPEKIAEYQANSIQERLERAPLDADLGQIRAIGYGKYEWDDEGNPDHVVKIDIGMPEDEMIKQFWSSFSKHGAKTCGYNTLGFDLPYLMRRSMDLGITLPMFPNLARYRTVPTRDLMAILYNWGPAKSLKWVAKRYGIPNLLPDMDGSKVAEMDDETLAAYASNDIHMTMELHTKMQGVYFP